MLSINQRTSPTVFISYAHEGDLAERVGKLAAWLTEKGVEVITDHPYKNRPPEKGWRAWMQHNIEDADTVLIVCSERYKKLFEKREVADIGGLGAAWESAIITADLYQIRLKNKHFYPILPDSGGHSHIPTVLLDWHNGHCFPSGNDRILSLIRDEVIIPTPKGMHRLVETNDQKAEWESLQQHQPKTELTLSNKFHGKQRSEILNFLAADWRSRGPAVAILQGFPGCGKTQLALSVAAKSPRSLDPVEPKSASQDSSVDLLEALAMALDNNGIPDVWNELDKGADSNLFNALLRVLRREKILIIIDEFQRLFSDNDTRPPDSWQYLVENLNNSVRPAGRLLLISNRSIKHSPWCERCVIKELNGLTDSEAAVFLQELLKSRNLTSKVPSERLEEISHRLGGNPRALMTLVGNLIYDSIDELIPLAPDLFKPGDVKIDRDLVEEFETALIERTLFRLDEDLLKFMRWMAVHRRPFWKEAFFKFPDTPISTQSLRKQLIDRFLLEDTPNGNSLHPLAREISVTRLRESKEEWRQAHNIAADYHFRHFKALQMKDAQKIATSYAELRHHLFQAGRIGELYHASEKLAKFALSQIPKTAQSHVPDNLETLEEHIALISALPEDQRPKGLEYHLALCLKHRNIGDDYQKALQHVRRATGPNAYYAVWLLFIELEYSLNGIDAMLKAQNEALRHLGGGSNAFAVYHRCANILGKDNRVNDAIKMLEKGIYTPGITCLSSLIGLCSGYMEQAGRYDDAIRILEKGIVTPNMPELGKLYVRCAKLMATRNRLDDAILLLKRGIKIPKMTYLYSFYLTLAEFIVKDGKDEDAIRWLKEGMSDSRVIDPKSLYCLCAELLVKNGRIDEATVLLEKGISSKVLRDPVPLYHSFATIMENSGNTDGGVKFLKQAMSNPRMSLEPSIYLVCAKLLFHARNLDDAINVLKQGLLVPNMREKGQLYQMCAEYTSRQGRLSEAIELLEKGIAEKELHHLDFLYLSCSELMEKTGRLEDAIELLKKGIKAPALTNKVVIFQACAKLLAKADRTTEGIELLEKAIHLPGTTGLVLLYQTCAKLMASEGRHNDAVQLLSKAINGPKIGNLVSLYQLCADMLISTGHHEKAVSLLRKGFVDYPKDKNLKLFYEKAIAP